MPRQWFLAHVLLRVLTTTLRFFGSTQWVTSEIYNWMQYLVISFLKLIRGKKKLSTKNVLQTCINFRSETLVFESGSLKQVQGSPATPRLSRSLKSCSGQCVQWHGWGWSVLGGWGWARRVTSSPRLSAGVTSSECILDTRRRERMSAPHGALGTVSVIGKAEL